MSAIVLACLGTAAIAGQSEMEMVLVPIAPTTVFSGAYGSVWGAEVRIFNDSDQTVVYRKPGCDLLIPQCGDREGVLPGKTAAPFVPRGPETPGAFLHVPRSLATQVRIGGSVGNSSVRSSRSQLPLPRENAFTPRCVLVHVVMTGNVRGMLRIYGATDATLDARVRVYDAAAGTLRGERTIRLAPGTASAVDGTPEHPAYHELDLSTDFPTIGSALELRIEVDALTAHSKLWAFVSVTDNVTQALTLSTPQ